ncbi:MAG: hypothetical protein IKO74_11670 [Selenomonadaceae bacterium]|nr:hypothetical protein [Selenomonadaceae bacterium]
MDNQRHELDDFFLCVADFVPAIKNLKNGYEAILRFGYDVNKVRPETLIDADDEFYHRLANDFKAASDSIRSGCPLILTVQIPNSREIFTIWSGSTPIDPSRRKMSFFKRLWSL